MAKFAKISENQVTRAILRDFYEKLEARTQNTDVIIVGAGPSGLVAGRDLAKEGLKVLILESNNYCGGGFWVGGYFMNGVTFRAPGQVILDEIGCPYTEAEPGLYIAPGPHAASKLIAAACDAGVQILNLTKFDDVVIRKDNRVSGVVLNWSPVSALPRSITCVDPIALESKLVIDATGHDAWVAQALERRGLIKMKGMGAMWVEESEDLHVEYTREVHPGLIVAGIAIATVDGIPRMGPTFGGMLLSGRRAAEVAKESLAALV